MIGRLSSKVQRYEFQAKLEFDRIWSIRYLVGQAPEGVYEFCLIRKSTQLLWIINTALPAIYKLCI